MIYHILGSILVLIGCSHFVGVVDRVEPEIILYIQRKFNPLQVYFKEIWFFGRTSFTLIVLVFLTCFDWKMGLAAAGVFLVTVCIEYFVKKLSNRGRPYTSHPAIAMLQPLEPADSSFPSGDTLRVWYLALIIPAASGNSSFVLTAAISLAVLVTLGRMVMGVHYFTDTLAGAGLGILGAGTTLWLWNLMNIF